jgi:ribosomal-protein-alanine N-acetyltransferase
MTQDPGVAPRVWSIGGRRRIWPRDDSDMAFSELFTERLRLRRITEADLGAVIAISTDPRTNEHRPRGAPTIEESNAIARDFIDDWQRHGIGYWVVEHKGRVIGIAGVKPVRLGGGDYWNLYYRFSPVVWGKGLAAEATRAAIAAAGAHTPARPVIARTRPNNTPAAQLALAIGMTRQPELDADGYITYASASRPRQMHTVAGQGKLPVEIETDRLLLAPIHSSDLDDLARMYTDPEVMRGSSGIAKARSREECSDWLSHALSAREKPWHTTFGVENRVDHRFIGRCGLRPDEASPETELAYAFVPAAWGKGFATEAARAVLDWGAGKGLARLIACALDDNPASRGVLEKIGMSRTGQRATAQGDLVLYELDLP